MRKRHRVREKDHADQGSPDFSTCGPHLTSLYTSLTRGLKYWDSTYLNKWLIPPTMLLHLLILATERNADMNVHVALLLWVTLFLLLLWTNLYCCHEFKPTRKWRTLSRASGSCFTTDRACTVQCSGLTVSTSAGSRATRSTSIWRAVL
jgi:hypothetical protein